MDDRSLKAGEALLSTPFTPQVLCNPITSNAITSNPGLMANYRSGVHVSRFHDSASSEFSQRTSISRSHGYFSEEILRPSSTISVVFTVLLIVNLLHLH